MKPSLPALHDIILPAPPEWWPLPWTAWLLALLMLLILGALAWWTWRQVKRLRRRRFLLDEWGQALAQSEHALDNPCDLANQFLKRASAYLGNTDAPLASDAQWQQLLQQSVPEKARPTLDDLLSSRYQLNSAIGHREVDSLVRQCIRRWS